MRPKSVIMAYFREVMVIPENALILDPVYLEVN